MADKGTAQRFVSRLPTSGAGLLDCWHWQGFITSDGYGRYGDGRYFDGDLYAHRIAWRLAHDLALIPEGHEVDHACFVHDCVNPLHLRCVPWAANRKQAPWLQPDACPQGHPYDTANTYWRQRPRLSRACRECMRAATRRWRREGPRVCR